MAPWSSRSTIRLVLIAEIETMATGTVEPRPIAEVLDFGRLAPHVRRNSEVFVHCHGFTEYASAAVTWSRAAGKVKTERAVGAVWATPGSGTDFYVQLVDITSQDGIADLVAALEDMYYGDVVFADTDPAVRRVEGGRTHQMVVFSEFEERELTDDEVQRLIYRADLAARPEYSEIVRPSELNRRQGRGAALGPFVSVLWGQQDYIENCAFLSAITGTTAAVVMVEARSVLMAEIATMGEQRADRVDAEETRERLDRVNRIIATIENRIALCIDGLSTIMPYIPALRVESFHRCLFDALDTEFNRTALQRLLDRLRELVRLEQEMLSSRLAQESEDRSTRWSLTIGLASVLTIPFGIIFGFFGVDATQVDGRKSMFAHQYWPIFVIVAGATLAIGAVHFLLYQRHRRQARERDQ